MRALDETLTDEQHGRTLAAVLREHYAELSWNRCRALCRDGRVRLDGSVVTDGATRVARGSRIEVAPQAPRQRRGHLQRDAILFEDRDVVVVHKPAGLMTVPFAGERDTLVDITQATLRRKNQKTGKAELGVVQRLDKETSGVLVFTRTLAAKRALQSQFRARSVHRLYRAIAHGQVEEAEYDTLLVRDRGDGLRGSWGHFRRERGKPPGDARAALTRVRPLKALAGATLVECKLGTGRQHQIRIHLAEAGHPLLGESVYVRDYEPQRIRAPRLMLHAGELGFEHPRTGKFMRFRVEPPEDFRQTLRSLQG